jgi:hypothetical protein
MGPQEIRRIREEAQARLERSRLDGDVNALLQRELAQINDRDVETVTRRLDEIEEHLRGEVEEFDRLLFGGSVAKHTYVDGLSDTDCLVVLEPKVVGDRSPEELRGELEGILRRRLDMGQVEHIGVGKLAVTVAYRDGTEIQLLPAKDEGGVLAISSPDGRSWAPIDPKAFSSRLTRLNDNQAGCVVPAIKLAKAIIANQVPESDRPSGYHLEALAVASFQEYQGPRTPKAMVQRFFETASRDAMRPIMDVTGQSEHVDSYLGLSGSHERQRLSARLEDIATSMRTARSTRDWEALLHE